MFCPNCGAEYDENEAKCPYCGTINPRGAQREYMEKLRRISKETGELAEEAEESVRADTRRNSRWLVRTVLIAGIIFLAIFGAVKLHEYREDRRMIERLREEALFEQKYFPEMDRLYEADDTDGLLRFLDEHAEEPGYSAVYSWKHYYYCEHLEVYSRLQHVWEEIQGGDRSADTYALAAYDAFYLTRMENDHQNITEKDKENLKESKAFAEEILEEMLQTDEDGVDEFYESLLDKYGILDYDKLKKAMRDVPK